MKKEIIPKTLKEIVDKGFETKRYDLDYSKNLFYYIDAFSDKLIGVSNESLVNFLSEENNIINVGYCFDGSFLPIRNGACYTISNLMKALTLSGKVSPTLMLCYRGWDNPEHYYNQYFRTVFINPYDYYQSTGIIEKIFLNFNISIAQFYSSEGVLNLAQRLDTIGIKKVFEIQNIDHILFSRLGNKTNKEINDAKNLQSKAIKQCDYVLCRSSFDLSEAIKLGAQQATSSQYKGGIPIQDFKFIQKDSSNYKLVFLGHLYYEPNENALSHIVNMILPKLPKKYSLTVIGIAPKKIYDKYSDSRIIFKKGVDNLSDELANYDIALAPITEGSGTRTKILDYMAIGLPIITTNLGIEGLDPQIKNYLFVEDNLDSYSKIIENISINRSLYNVKMKNGRDYIEQIYSWANCLEPFLNIYLS